MRFKATFKTTDQAFPADFGAVQTASDGGYEKGYSAGYGAGLADGAGESAELEAKIDESGVLDGTEQSLDEKVDGLIEYAGFKNLIQETLYVSKNLRSSVFAGTSITDVSMFDFSQMTVCGYLFSNTDIESLEIDLSSATNMQNFCSPCTKLKYIVFTKGTPNASIWLNAFTGCSSLERIENVDFSKATGLGTAANGPFTRCNALEHLTVAEGCIKVNIWITSPVLSDESIQSIIDGLADLTGGTQQTLTLHATVTAKLTEAQIATITRKNWVVA